MYHCECGTLLRNIYPFQLDKHRRSKKHLNCLLARHMEWDKQKQKATKKPDIAEQPEEPTPEIANNEPVEISFD